MKIEKNKFVKVFWKREEFNKRILPIENVKGLILDTIKVFGIMNSYPEKETECEFLIKKYDNGETCVIPSKYFDRYIIVAERCGNATVIEIKSEDYNHYTETMSGDYRFVLNDSVKIED